MNKTIMDIKCPKCGSYHTVIYGTDELEFYPDGTGFYSPYVSCLDCKHSFRMWYDFKYEVTKEWER